jgi:hypothetical protein
MTVYSKIKKEYLEQISALTTEYRAKLWHELSKVNLADFNDFLRENSQYVRWIDLENMTYLRAYVLGSGFYEADFSKMPLDDITEVFNQLERYAS